MPTYQYACTESECGHEFEAVQSFSDVALSDCPSCEGRLRKVFSAVGVVFKGPGFYRTDSRESGRKKEKENAAANGNASTKTDSTPSSSSPSGSSSGSSGSGSSGSGSSGGGSSAGAGGSTAKSAAAS